MRRRQRVTIWERDDKECAFVPLADHSGRWTVLLPAGACLVSDEHRGVLVDDGDPTFHGPADVLAFARVPAFGYTIAEGWEIDGDPAPVAPPRPPVSPIDCKHHGRLLVVSSTGGPPHRSHHVYVCSRCGQFAVSGDNEGHRFRVEFELPTARMVKAAGRYCHLLAMEA